jgi:ribulose-phosphate 3-epimerase
MIVQPERFIRDFANAGAAYISVHYEACTHLHRTVYAIKEAGVKAGVAINPHTPIHLLTDIISDVDLVCMMGVNPGFGGQKFIENTYQKCAVLKELILKKQSSCLIEIDGGVNEETGYKLVNTGADVLVAGNYVFAAGNPKEKIARLKNIFTP